MKNKTDFEKRMNVKINAQKTCKCGHRLLLGLKDKGICSWCGRYVFKDKSTEFKYRLNEKINKVVSNE